MTDSHSETTDGPGLSAEAVQALGSVAELSFEPERAEDLAERLTVWFAGANELSAKMSAPEHLPRGPITTFTHPDSELSE
jgi:hypothetical protein